MRAEQTTIHSASCEWSHIFWLMNSHSRLFITLSLESAQLNVDWCVGVKNDFFRRRVRMEKRNCKTISEHSIRVYQHIISRCVDVILLFLFHQKTEEKNTSQIAVCGSHSHQMGAKCVSHYIILFVLHTISRHCCWMVIPFHRHDCLQQIVAQV